MLQYSLTRIRLYIAVSATVPARALEGSSIARLYRETNITWCAQGIPRTDRFWETPEALVESQCRRITYRVAKGKKEATRKHYLPDTTTGGKVTCLFTRLCPLICRLNNIEAVVRQKRGVALGLGCSWPCQDNSDKHVLSNLVSCCRLNRLSYQAVS